MALTRNFLKAMGLTDEQVNSIIESHADTVDALKKERDEWKGKAGNVDTLTRERDEALEKLSKAGDATKVQKEFDEYKAGIEREKINGKKRAALLSVFEQAGVKREKFRDVMLKSWDVDKVELDDNGAAKDVEGIKATITKEFADFIATEQNNNVPPTNPPGGGSQKITAADIEKMSYDEINKMWDANKGNLKIDK